MLAASTAFAGVLYLTNLTRAPDFGIDETFYALAGQHAIGGNSITFPTGPITVHPPVFFLSVGLWLALWGHLHSPALQAIYSARYFAALCDMACVVLVGTLARSWSVNWPSRDRGRVLILATLLTALNGFLLRFGRVTLIEPMALAASLLALNAAWWVRRSATVIYATVLGAAIGLALLIKEPTLFLVISPLVAAVFQRDGRKVWRNALALAVGGLLWLSWPLWAAWSGIWSPFVQTQTLSIRRLLGLAQTSGLNQPQESPLRALADTFGQYVGGYITFAAGGAVLAVVVMRQIRRRSPRLGSGPVQLIALGICSYAFLLYSIGFGQSNPQLTVYAVPASALLVASAPTLLARRAAATGPTIVSRAVRRLVTVAVALGLVLGVGGWLTYFVATPDNATQRVEQFIETHIPPCVRVNSTGDAFTWQATLRTNPVTSFSSGPEALAHNVHVFLDSPKDAAFHYSNSNPALSAWLSQHGKRIYELPSHTNQSISVWVVNGISLPKQQSPAACVRPLAAPHNVDPTNRFAILAGIGFGVDALILAVGWLWLRRRRGNAGLLPRVGGRGQRHTAGVLTAASVVAGVMNYGYAMLLTYRLAPASYATFAAAQSLILVIGVIGSAGVPWVLAQETTLADRLGDRQRLDRAVSFAFWVNLGLGLLAAAAIGGAVLSFAGMSDAVLVAATVLTIFVGSTGFGVLQGRGYTRALALLVVAEVVVKVAVGFSLVYGVRPTSANALAGNCAAAGVFLLILPAAARHVGRPRRPRVYASLSRAAGRMGALQIGVGVMSSVDILFAGSLAAAHGAGASYQVASTLGKVPLFISSAVSTAVFPTLALGGLHRRIDALRTYGLIAAFVCVSLLTVPAGLIHAVFPDSYSSISRWLVYTAVSGAAFGALNLLTTFVQSYRHELGGPRPTGLLMITGVTVFMVATTAIGSVVGGLPGLAVSTVIGALVAAGAFAALPVERVALAAVARSLIRPRRRLAYLVAAALALALTSRDAWLWLPTAVVVGCLTVVAAFPEYALPVSRRLARLNRRSVVEVPPEFAQETATAGASAARQL